MQSFFNLKNILKEKIKLRKVNNFFCDTSSLANLDQFNIREAFSSDELEQEWSSVEKEISELTIPHTAGGVNLGDRKAIYYLVRYLRPKSVLEIGTHIGASTIHFAMALKLHDYELTTVDICDVNHITLKPWLEYGAIYSPMEMIKKLNCENRVTFVVDDSRTFFLKNQKKYDLIFLDGDHSALTVYQEIPMVLKALEKGGYILLHDYFPNLKPLWSNGVVTPGPFLATEKLKAEGANISVLPFGSLPWTTKLKSNVTSLALLGSNLTAT